MLGIITLLFTIFMTAFELGTFFYLSQTLLYFTGNKSDTIFEQSLNSYNLNINEQIIFLLTILLIFFRFLINMLFVKLSNQFSFSFGYRLLSNMFLSFLKADYLSIKTNIEGSAFFKAVSKELPSIIVIMNSIFLILSEFFLIISVILVVAYFDFQLTITVIILLLILIYLFLTKIRPIISNLGIKREASELTLFRLFSMTYNLFKASKFSPIGQSLLLDLKKKYDVYKDINVKNIVWQNFPRIFIECLGFIGLITFLYYFDLENEGNKSFYAFAGVIVFRVLPSFNRVLSNVHTINFLIPSLNVYLFYRKIRPEELFEKKLLKSISLKNIFFSYNSEKPVIQNSSVSITKGDWVWIKGESGSGKSTILDLILGLIKPTHGKVILDGNNNRSLKRDLVSYLGQNYYIFKGSAQENITFGLDVNKDKIKKILEIVKLSGIINLNTKIDEDGQNLSGGQKQRLALARAIYAKCDVLILDEPSSSLDDKTAKSIITALKKYLSPKVTVIIVDHRKHFSSFCSKIISLNKGSVRVDIKK